MSINWWVDKTECGIFMQWSISVKSEETEWDIQQHKQILKASAKWNKPYAKGYILYDAI